jgi:UDP-2,3-diacylglucosamine pyrophosphatase LpxH
MIGRGKVSLSKKIKDNVKTAVKYINNFEETAAMLAIKNGYDYVICGHIHHPDYRTVTDQKNNSIVYLNSGDWIENLTSLEYNNRKWLIYKFREDKYIQPEHEVDDDPQLMITEMDNKEIFQQMVEDFQK